MKIIKEGHTYLLKNVDNGCQTIQFIDKTPNLEKPTQLDLVSDGTTNEEVLRMLINRMQHLQKQFPCRENALVITKLEESLMWLEKRTADRVARNVEGKQII
jgi:hypothetical protein